VWYYYKVRLVASIILIIMKPNYRPTRTWSAPIQGPFEKEFQNRAAKVSGYLGMCCHWGPTQQYINVGTAAANKYLSSYSPIEIVIATLLISYLLKILYQYVRKIQKAGIISTLFKCAVKLPFING
jgi:hypothetical protein